MDRAVGKLHPESLEDADAIMTSRADQKRRVIIHKSAPSNAPVWAGTRYADGSGRQAGLSAAVRGGLRSLTGLTRPSPS